MTSWSGPCPYWLEVSPIVGVGPPRRTSKTHDAYREKEHAVGRQAREVRIEADCQDLRELVRARPQIV